MRSRLCYPKAEPVVDQKHSFPSTGWAALCSSSTKSICICLYPPHVRLEIHANTIQMTCKNGAFVSCLHIILESASTITHFAAATHLNITLTCKNESSNCRPSDDDVWDQYIPIRALRSCCWVCFMDSYAVKRSGASKKKEIDFP